MEWLALVGVTAVFVWLMVKYPKFRYFSIGLVALVLSYSTIESIQNTKRRDAEKRLAKSPERKEILSFAEKETWLRLDGVGSKIHGTAINKSANLTITKFRLNVIVRECGRLSGNLAGGCPIIGDVELDVFVTIPPLQKRAFSGRPHFEDLPKVKDGEWSWNFLVLEVSANQVIGL